MLRCICSPPPQPPNSLAFSNHRHHPPWAVISFLISVLIYVGECDTLKTKRRTLSGVVTRNVIRSSLRLFAAFHLVVLWFILKPNALFAVLYSNTILTFVYSEKDYFFFGSCSFNSESLLRKWEWKAETITCAVKVIGFSFLLSWSEIYQSDSGGRRGFARWFSFVVVTLWPFFSSRCKL